MKVIDKIRKNNFVRNSSNYFLGSIGTSAITFLTIPIFTRLLIPHDYGQISLFNSFLSVNTIIFSLGFVGAFSNKFLKEKEEFPTFVGTNLVFLFFVQAFFLIVLLLFNNYIANFFKIDKIILILADISGILMVEYQIYQSYLKVSLQSKKFVFLSFVYTIVNISLSILLILLLKEKRYYGRIIGYLLGILFVSIISFRHLFKLAEFKFEKRHLFYALGFGIPFIPHLAAQFLLSASDRIVINQLTNSANTGLYSFAYSIGTIMAALAVALITAFIPAFYDYLKKGDYKAINDKVRVLTDFIFLAAIFMIFFSKEIVMIMADKKYYSALGIVPWIITGNVFFYFYMIYSVYATYEKKTGVFSLFTILAGGINISLNYLLIPHWGYKTAAITTLISYILLFLFHYLNAKYIMKKKVIPIILNIKGFIVFLTFIPLELFLTDFFKSFIISFVSKLILLGIVGVILFREQVVKYLKSVTDRV